MAGSPNFPIIVVPIACVGIVVLARGTNADHRSSRLARSSVGLGILAWSSALLGPYLEDTGHTSATAFCGGLTMIIALVAVACAIGAFIARRRDLAIGLVIPIVGIGLGALNLFLGGVLIVGFLRSESHTAALSPNQPDTSWVWKSEIHGIEVTIPSNRWVAKPNPNILAAFNSRSPYLMGVIGEVRPAKTEEEYQSFLQFAHRFKTGATFISPNEQTFTNSHGHQVWQFVSQASGNDGPYLLGVSVTRLNDRAVLLLFEGQQRGKSDEVRDQELAALRLEANRFLGSVKAIK